MAIDFQCLAQKRPDVIQYHVSSDARWNTNQPELIFANWWTMDRAHAPQVNPDPSAPPPPGMDDSGSFYDLLSYAIFKGCATTSVPITVPPNTSPGSGGRVTGPPDPATAQGQFQSAMAWAKANPLAVGIGIAVLALVFYKPAPVSFS